MTTRIPFQLIYDSPCSTKVELGTAFNSFTGKFAGVNSIVDIDDENIAIESHNNFYKTAAMATIQLDSSISGTLGGQGGVEGLGLAGLRGGGKASKKKYFLDYKISCFKHTETQCIKDVDDVYFRKGIAYGVEKNDANDQYTKIIQSITCASPESTTNPAQMISSKSSHSDLAKPSSSTRSWDLTEDRSCCEFFDYIGDRFVSGKVYGFGYVVRMRIGFDESKSMAEFAANAKFKVDPEGVGSGRVTSNIESMASSMGNQVFFDHVVYAGVDDKDAIQVANEALRGITGVNELSSEAKLPKIILALDQHVFTDKKERSSTLIGFQTRSYDAVGQFTPEDEQNKEAFTKARIAMEDMIVLRGLSDKERGKHRKGKSQKW